MHISQELKSLASATPRPARLVCETRTLHDPAWPNVKQKGRASIREREPPGKEKRRASQDRTRIRFSPCPSSLIPLKSHHFCTHASSAFLVHFFPPTVSPERTFTFFVGTPPDPRCMPASVALKAYQEGLPGPCSLKSDISSELPTAADYHRLSAVRKGNVFCL